LRLNHLLESLVLVANDSYYPTFCMMPRLRSVIDRMIQDPVSALFVATALFAAGSVGFFLAVAIQSRSPQEFATLTSLTEAEKVVVMDSLEESTDTQGRSMTEARAGLTTEQKLDILKSLNTR
jgi:hypothetical protein